MVVGHKAGQTANAVAAHLRLAAVPIENAHPQITPLLRWQRQNAPVGSDAQPSITELSHMDPIGFHGQPGAAIHDHKVIAKTLVFGKFHRRCCFAAILVPCRCLTAVQTEDVLHSAN